MLPVGGCGADAEVGPHSDLPAGAGTTAKLAEKGGAPCTPLVEIVGSPVAFSAVLETALAAVAVHGAAPKDDGDRRGPSSTAIPLDLRRRRCTAALVRSAAARRAEAPPPLPFGAS